MTKILFLFVCFFLGTQIQCQTLNKKFTLPNTYLGFGWFVRFAYDDVFYPSFSTNSPPSISEIFFLKDKFGLNLGNRFFDKILPNDSINLIPLVNYNKVVDTITIIPVLAYYELYYENIRPRRVIDTATNIDLINKSKMLQIFYREENVADSFFYTNYSHFNIDIIFTQ